MILAGCPADTGLEVAVEVALVGEACCGGGRGDRFSLLEQSTRLADAVGDLELVGSKSYSLAEDADEAELANPGGVSELVEADVAREVFGEIFERLAQRAVVVLCGWSLRCTSGGMALNEVAQPFGELVVCLESD